MNQKKGQVTGTAITLVIAAVALIVGVYVFVQVEQAIPALTGTANTTVGNIITTTLNAFQLATVALIVLAAVAVLAILFLLGRRK